MSVVQDVAVSSSPSDELFRAMRAAEDFFLGVDQQVPPQMLCPAKSLTAVVALPDWSRSERGCRRFLHTPLVRKELALIGEYEVFRGRARSLGSYLARLLSSRSG